MKIELDSQPALLEVAQITQQVKQLYQLLQQVKSVFAELGVGGGSPGGFLGGSGTASSAAQSSSSTPNLAGAVGGGGGANLAQWLTGGWAGAVGAVNPSIIAAQTQSVAAGMSLPARNGMGQFVGANGAVAGNGGASSSVSSAFGSASSGNPFNPFAGDSAMGPSAQIGNPGVNLNTMLYNQWQQQQATAADMRFAVGAGIMHGVGQISSAYAQSVVTGDQNQMGFGAAYGGMGGAVAGAIAGSFLPGVGTLIGAGIGATVGSGVFNAFQAPSVATLETQKMGAVTAATMGVSTERFASSANQTAGIANERFVSGSRGFSINQIPERIGRMLHLYTGDDVVSQQDAADTMGALYSANASNGTVMSMGELGGASERFIGRYKGESASIAKAMAPALSRARRQGGNLTDLIGVAGMDATVLFARDLGRGADADALGSGYGSVLDSQYASEGAASIARGLSADYGASGYGGRSTRARTGEFNAMIGGMRSQIGALDGEISALSALPDGANSNEVKAKKAIRQELLRDIARESSQRAGSVFADVGSDASVRYAGDNAALTRANLYGGAGDFAGVNQKFQHDLNVEDSDLRQALTDPNATYSDKQRARSRLREIGSQRLTMGAQTAGASMRRDMLSGDVAGAQAGYGYNYASAYGTDGDVGAAALGGINAQQGIIQAGIAALSNPNLSAEDRAAVQMRMAGAQNTQLQLQIGSRDTLLSRISGRAGVAQGGAGFVLTRAAVLGTGNDVRSASAGLVGAYNDETGQINSQLAAGGLTTEQELRLKGRLNSLKSETFGAEQNAIDAGYAKDDLTGYTTKARGIQGQMDRLQYLPFSASNPIKLSLQQIQLNTRQIGVLDSREAALRSAGNLSPEREDQIEAQRQGLYTQNAAAVSQVGEGFINRLPGMSAGAPSFSGRLNSYSMAAAQLSLMGSPIRSFGAANGSALQTQDDFIRAAGGSPDDIKARSNTMGLNNDNGQVVSLLARIAAALEGSTGGNGGMRPGEAAGNAYGALARRDLGQVTPSSTHN